jgi:hypothetical protein
MAKAVISQSVVDVSRLLHDRMAKRYPAKCRDVAAQSPYLTRHVKRIGDYVINLPRVLPLITPFI